jgi:hypothetical protein
MHVRAAVHILCVSAFSLPPRHVKRPRFGTALQSPAPVAGCQVDRRGLTVAGQLAEGVFKRRDAKNAEKRALAAAVISAPTKPLSSGRQQASLFVPFASLA